ncbi:MAG TPA: RidA family protein [Gammaproteobacteria bacterium]|jgi:enamine deaminase RidA (YjgF/YER057c/UK114 family)|nr:RidA family protein [Gammaproteobacteria bacterium]HIK77046.1 RidA family protein [Gammaproteobacteria bacterium]
MEKTKIIHSNEMKKPLWIIPLSIVIPVSIISLIAFVAPPTQSEPSTTNTEEILEIERYNPQGLSQPTGYSQVVTIKGKYKTIHLGGKAGIYEDDTFPESLEEQSDLTFENIRIALAAAGASPKDVVDIQIYIVNLQDIDFDTNPVYADVRNFFPLGHKPTSMVIGVSDLAYPGLLVEVNVKAVIAED